MSEKNWKEARELIDPRHWKREDYTQRMSRDDWRTILLNDAEQNLTYRGQIRHLVAKEIGMGLVEVSKNPIREPSKKNDIPTITVTQNKTEIRFTPDYLAGLGTLHVNRKHEERGSHFKYGCLEFDTLDEAKMVIDLLKKVIKEVKNNNG